MTHLKCWVCNSWTPEDLTEKMDFEGTEAIVCRECAQMLETRANKLRAMRGTRNVTPSQTGAPTLAGQLASGGPDTPPGDADAGGAGPEPEPVGSGPAPDAAPAPPEDRCAYPGCPGKPTHAQMIKTVMGEVVHKKVCKDHMADFKIVHSGEKIIGVERL